MKKVLNVIYKIEPIYRLTKLHKLEQKYYHQDMFKIADEVLEKQRKPSSEDLTHKSEETNFEITRHPKNYIETLLESRLSQEEIRDEINTLVAAVSFKNIYANKYINTSHLIHLRATKRRRWFYPMRFYCSQFILKFNIKPYKNSRKYSVHLMPQLIAML